MGVFELLHQVIDHPLIPVVTTEVVVAAGGLDLHHAFADFQQGDVEGATTEVENQDHFLVFNLFQAIGQCRCGGLVDNALDLQASDLASLFGGLALGVVEVRRNGDDRVGHFVAKVCLRVSLEFAEHARTDFLRRVLLPVNVHAPAGAHVALDRTDGAVNVGDGLPLGHFADQNFAVLGESHDGRGGAGAFRVGNHRRFAAFEDGNDGVGGTEVDADCSSHGELPPVKWVADCFTPSRHTVQGLGRCRLYYYESR